LPPILVSDFSKAVVQKTLINGWSRPIAVNSNHLVAGTIVRLDVLVMWYMNMHGVYLQ
jgi:hypothetical protein